MKISTKWNEISKYLNSYKKWSEEFKNNLDNWYSSPMTNRQFMDFLANDLNLFLEDYEKQKRKQRIKDAILYALIFGLLIDLLLRLIF